MKNYTLSPAIPGDILFLRNFRMIYAHYRKTSGLSPRTFLPSLEKIKKKTDLNHPEISREGAPGIAALSPFCLKFIFIFLCLSIFGGCMKHRTREPLAVEKIPFAANTFDIYSDKHGNTMLAYSEKGKLFFSRKEKGQELFSGPVMVNADGPDTDPGTVESGAKIVAGPAGSIIIAWKGKDGGIYVSLSPDSGKSWTNTQIRDSLNIGVADMPAVVSGPSGKIYVIWTDTRGADISADRYAANVFLDLSEDGGKTFRKDQNLTGGKIQACPCCQPALSARSDGSLLIAYRSSEKSIKEIQLVRADIRNNRQEISTVSADNWFFPGCPTSGPSMTVGSQGKAVNIVWTSDNTIYSNSSADGGKSFGRQVILGAGRYHSLEKSADGVYVTVWDSAGMTWYRSDDNVKTVLNKGIILPGRLIWIVGRGFTLFVNS